MALGRTFGDIKTCDTFGITSEPEISQCALKDGDYVMVASDGYWDVCSNSETLSMVTGASKAHRPCKEIAQILVQKARARGSRDDISVLIVRYTEPKA